jgi:DNA-binding response OmpR family regulator
MLDKMLTPRGFTVEMAEDGVEGVTKAREIRPDLILLDLYLPHLDGFGVMEQLKEDPHTHDIPIIVISAWPTGDNRRRVREAGALDFVVKPFQVETLVNLIQESLSE